MVGESEECLAYVTRIQTEHKRLRECLQLIEQQWAAQQRRHSPAASKSKVISGLEALRVDLASHFKEEECGGCLEEAVSHQASLSHDLTRLEREHPKLLGQLDRLVERTREHSRAGDSIDKIKPEFLRFAGKLHAHEAAENRILEQGFGIEID